MKINQNVKNAINISLLCSLTYLAVYFTKNILSAVSPQMLESGVATQNWIGSYSSFYFMCYAVGQLINGSIGDKIKARYMICFGVILAGVSNLFFVNLLDTPAAARLAYGATGLFLSMIFGPLTKLVAENTDPAYTHRCNLTYTYAAYLGSPLAGLAASLSTWKVSFYVSIVALIFMGSLCYIIFLNFEKRGIIVYNKFNKKEKEKVKANQKLLENIRVLLKHRIAKFALVAIITGVVRTAVVFWMPMYLSQKLGFSAETAATAFTVATLVLSLNAFIAVFVYEKLKRNMDLTIFLAFVVSTTAFSLVYIVKHPVFNIIFLVCAVLASNCASSMLWSRYCPSLRETGLVSTTAGFLDFASYMAASAASKLFANAVSAIGWGNLVLVWVLLMLFGVVISFPYRKAKKECSYAK